MSTNITLTWTEINCLKRNGVIITYVIQYGEGTNRNIAINTQSNATTHLITGLKPFTQYTFTVAGVNSVSTGPFSTASRSLRTSEYSKCLNSFSNVYKSNFSSTYCLFHCINY